jgi:hypothetical protein
MAPATPALAPGAGVCRPDDLNLAVDVATGELDADSLPVMAEDAIIGHGTPILKARPRAGAPRASMR